MTCSHWRLFSRHLDHLVKGGEKEEEEEEVALGSVVVVVIVRLVVSEAGEKGMAGVGRDVIVS